MYESTIEKNANHLIFSYLGIKSIKLQIKGWPDRMYLAPNGRVFFIEFKRPNGGRLSNAQKHRVAELKLLGHDVEVVDDAIGALEFACECLESAQLPSGGNEVLTRARRVCAIFRAGGGENINGAWCIKDAYISAKD